jgi:hypothetical protein
MDSDAIEPSGNFIKVSYDFDNCNADLEIPWLGFDRAAGRCLVSGLL